MCDDTDRQTEELPKLNLKKLSLVSEPLNAAGAGREACQVCGLFRECTSGFTRPYVPEGWTKKLLIVDASPKENEDGEPLRPFSGKAGKLLRKLWAGAGFVDSDIALVTAVRCSPRKGAAPSMKQTRACRPFLLKVLEVLQPENVLGLGAAAFRTLRNDGATNITKNRGKLLEVPWLKVTD